LSIVDEYIFQSESEDMIIKRKKIVSTMDV
jgi:hypothetical protein